MRPRILVTRPEPGATRTAARLAAAGFDAVVLPLTRIAPLDFAMPEGVFDAVIVTSAQALRKVYSARLRQLPLYAVGEATAKAAQRAGFADIRTGGGAVSSIVALVKASARPAAALLYLCGRVRRPELESALGAAGFRLTAVETYNAVPIDYPEAELSDRLGETPFDAVALMSAQAAELFSALAGHDLIERLFNRCEIVCFSPRIADALTGKEGWKIAVTENASEDALLELLSPLLAPDRS
jgi:uroporphyrinogen-III synthase